MYLYYLLSIIKSGLDSCIALNGFTHHPVLGCQSVSFPLRPNPGSGNGFDGFYYSLFIRMLYLIQNFLVTLIMMVWLSSWGSISCWTGCAVWHCTLPDSEEVVDRWVPHLGRTWTRELSSNWLFHRQAQRPWVRAHKMEMEMEGGGGGGVSDKVGKFQLFFFFESFPYLSYAKRIRSFFA